MGKINGHDPHNLQRPEGFPEPGKGGGGFGLILLALVILAAVLFVALGQK